MTPVQTPQAPAALRLLPQESLLLCVDIQERLCAAMSKDVLFPLVQNASRLIQGARILGVPVLVSEQYRRGLGPTLPELAVQLPVGGRYCGDGTIADHSDWHGNAHLRVSDGP